MNKLIILLLLFIFGVPLKSTAVVEKNQNIKNKEHENSEKYKLLIYGNNFNKIELQKILLSEDLYFYKINAFIGTNNTVLLDKWKIAFDPEWLKSDISWAVIGPNGLVHGGGQGNPTSAMLINILRRNNSSNMMKDLETFVSSNPNHVESRLALLRGYLERAGDLARRLNPKGERLSPTDDAFLWHPVVRHVEHLLAAQINATQLVDIFWGLPEEEIECQSQVIRAVYKRIQLVLMNYICADYTNFEIFYFLMRIDRVLGRSGTLDALQSIPVVLTPLHFVEFPPTLSEHLLNGAKKTGDYQQVVPLLARLWIQKRTGLAGGIARLELEDPSPSQYSHWQKANRLEQKRLTEAWNESLRPLLYAVVKAGKGEAEAVSLLNDLDERWKAVPLGTWLRELALELERPDLVQAWMAGGGPLRHVPLQRISLSPSYELFVVGPHSEETAKFGLWLVARGYRVSLRDDVRAWQRELLGWTDSSDQWALIGPDGKMLATGLRIPSMEQGLMLLRSSGMKTPMEMLKNFTTEHPEQLIPTLLLAQEWMRYLERVRPLDDTVWIEGLEADISRAETEYINSLEALLADSRGLFLAAPALPTWAILKQDSGYLATNLRRLAFIALPTIEHLMLNAPGNQSLGSLWAGLGSLVGRSWRNFHATIQQAPPLKNAWNTHSLLLMNFIGLLARNQRWEQIPLELEPAWGELIAIPATDRERSGAPNQPRLETQVASALAKAYLSLGDLSKARAVVQDWARLAPDLESRALMLGLASSMGYQDEAKLWSRILDGAEVPH